MKLREYIRLLERTEDDIPDVIDEFVRKRSTYLVGNVKLRFWNYGIDGQGNFLGNYAPSTKERKERQGQRSSHITLHDTGNWWDSLFAIWDRDKEDLSLDSTNVSLTSKLIDGEGNWFKGYGEGIMEFTDEELDGEIGMSVLQDLAKHLEGIFNKNIDIDVW